MRLIRRVIVKHFGSTRNFLLWVTAVIVTIYVIDSYVLTRDRLEALVQGPKSDVKRMNQAIPTKLTTSAAPPVPEPRAADTFSKKESAKDEAVKAKCGLPSPCPDGKFAYLVRSGEGRDGSPTMCFDGQYAMSPDLKNGHRGINIAVVNDKTNKVEEVRSFDTYSDDSALQRFLKLGVDGNKLILVATMDEASNSLKDESKKWLHQYGSSLVDKLKFRDGLAMIGQRGLTHGSAVEQYQSRERNEFAVPVEVRGCTAVPMGALNEVLVVQEEKPQSADAAAAADKQQAPGGVKVGEELANCGVKDGCGPEAFAVHVFTGVGNSQGPKICIGGKYVLAKGLNDGGRGFNVVIVDPKTKDVVRVGHFDTYGEDSSNLEIFLEMMNDGELVVAVTHDDASKRLSDHAKQLFNDMGSGMIQNLKFRDVWAFVGQKGIAGFSEIEQLEVRYEGATWPNHIDKRACVPTKLKGTKIAPDPMANKNEKRRKFCAKYDGYGDFCESAHIDDALTPAPLASKEMENSLIYDVPIIVVPGLNHNAVRMQLETLLLNPGVKVAMVTVMYDEKFTEPAALAELFGFRTAKLSSSTKYVYQMEKALAKVWELYPDAKHVVVLEEEVIVGPDFLYFLGQCLPAVDQDDSLIGVSAWNENGYEGSSGLRSLVYRTETFPGLGFLLKRSFYDLNMKDNMAKCCLKRSWDGWFGGALGEHEMVVPDVSRVYRRPYEGLSEQADMLTELFNRPRLTNLDAAPALTNVGELGRSAYEASVRALVTASTALATTNVADCLEGRGLGFYVPEVKGKVYTVFFEQSGASDHSVLSLLARCFHLYYVKGRPSRGLHNGMLRFSYKENTMLFIGSASPYYKHMPDGYKPVTRKS